MRGLIVGRFQPFHKGHLAVVREALGKCDELIVIIGSAEDSHTERNPFTAGERFQMILSCLTPEERTRTLVVPIRDVNRYSVWVNHIESYLPPFDIVFSNSDLTRALFKQAGYQVRSTKEYNGNLNATEVRRKIVSGMKWQHLVPPPVARILESINAKKRLIESGMKPSRRRS